MMGTMKRTAAEIERARKLNRLAEAHRELSKVDAPPAPDHPDGAVWNVDVASPAEAEAEFMRIGADLFPPQG